MSESIGLDIGAHSIKLVGLTMTSKGPFITHVGIKEIPQVGEKKDPTFVSEIIKALFREVDLKPGKVRLTVSGSGVNIRRITIPYMSKAELKEAVRWEIKGHLPFSIESARFDFHILNEFVEDNVKKLDLIVVACPNHLIERTISIAEGAGLKPIHLSVGPFALWNVLLALARFEKDEVVALIDLGSDKTCINLFKDGILQFSREITPAGADFTRAIMEGIASEGEPHLLYERAEKIKQEMGIPSKDSHISFLVRPVLERLAAEIKRSLDYYRNQFNIERIDGLLLTGGGANLKNLASYLGGELRSPVEHFNPLSKILFDSNKIDAKVLDEIGSALTVAAGAAFSEPKRIELLPPKESLLSRARTGKFINVMAPLITLLIFLWGIWHMNGQVNAIQKERDEKIAEVANLEMLQAKLKLLTEKEIKIKQELSIFPSSVTVSIPYREVLREVSHIVPDNVALALLSVQNKGKTQKEESKNNEGKELEIKGLAFGSDLNCLTALAYIIERLEMSPFFKNVKLVSAEENKSYNQPAAEFEIICDINPPLIPPLVRGDKEGLKTER